MLKIIALFLRILPILAVAAVVVFFVWRPIDRREAAAEQRHRELEAERDADQKRVGSKIQCERWVYKLNKWNNGKSKIEDALFAGAKRIDEMRRAKKNALR